MKYVLDASVAVKSALGEVNADKADRLIENYRQGIDELIAPNFFLVECGHALFRAARKKDITPAEAVHAFRAIIADQPLLLPTSPLLARAAAICQHIHKGFYDSVYIALAEQEGCTMITADSKLIRAAQGHYPWVVDLATLP